MIQNDKISCQLRYVIHKETKLSVCFLCMALGKVKKVNGRATFRTTPAIKRQPRKTQQLVKVGLVRLIIVLTFNHMS